jgi:hypothetical protein
MEKVLKKILREFYQSKWISVEVIGNLSDNQSSYLIENVYKKKIKLDSETKQKINSYFTSLKEKLSRINPFSGSFVDKYTGEEKSVEFNLIPTHHYAERLFRKEDPKYKTDERVVNPMEYEGVDLLVYNRDRLAQEILTKRIKHNDLVKVTTKDGSNYQMLVNFNNSGKKGSPQSYNLLLINQMKGKGLNFYTNDKELKLNSPR